MFAFLTSSSTAFFSSSVKAFEFSATTSLSGAFTVGAVVSAGFFAVAFPACFDSFPVLSFAFALTSVPSFTLSAGTVITPVSGSTVASDPSGTVHLPSSPFVAVTFLSFPSLSLYVTSTVFVSASVGGTTSTLPSSFAFTVGAAGAVLSGVFASAFVVAFAESDVFPASSFAVAVTSVLSATLSAGIVTFPDVGSTFTPSGASFGSVHFPSAPFVAVTVFGSVAPCGV